MTETLYTQDCYQKEFSAKIISIKDGKYIVLDRSAFYPKSGGVDCDNGTLTTEDKTVYNIISVLKSAGDIIHQVDKIGLNEGDTVIGNLNWERRYKLMRYHTAAHILSGVLSRDAGAKITGNDLSIDKGRIDFDLDDFDREKLEHYFELANELIKRDLPIKIYTITRAEAEDNPLIFKLAKALPESLTSIRIVEIVGFDRQADGGAHVKSLKEVGPITFIKAENKGKSNRRVYFSII